MFLLRKILSISVPDNHRDSVICASNIFAHDVSILPFQNTATVFYDNSIRDTLKLSYAIQTIYKDQNDNYIAILKDGTEKDVTPLLANAGRTMVEDAEGNKMVVTSDHRLMSAEQYHNTGKNSTLIKDENNKKDRQINTGEVIFKPSESQQFGFDAYNETINNYPEIYPALEGGYRPAYKSIAQWQTDKVLAEPTQGVTFRNQMGAPYATTNGEIILRGEPQPGETPVYAHVAETDSTTKVVGKLNLLTFEPREISVCLVPVNGATLPNAQTLEKELNKIFKPAVASVKLSTATPINIQYANGENFVHGGSGLLSVYSNDEKNAIKALQNADNDTYYLFVIDNVTRLNEDGTPMKDILAGYMPIGYQCGFLFGSPAAKYVAHELGHGAFGLHHTFSSETESFSAPQYSTDNLMDYADGTTLNHKQWTWMHEKHGSGLFGFLADESEGEAFVEYDYSIEGYGGAEAVLIHLFKHKDDIIEEVKQRAVTLNPDFAAEILKTFYGSKNVKILNNNEAYVYLVDILKYDRLCQIVNNKEKILQAIENETDKQRIFKLVLENIDSAIDIALDLSDVTFEWVADLREINNITKNFPIENIKDNNEFVTKISSHLNSNGKKEILLTLSNAKFKEVLRNNGITEYNDIQELLNLKNSRSKNFYTDSRIIRLTEGLSESQLSKILKKSSDLGIIAVASNDNNVTSSIFDKSLISPKISNILEIAGNAVDLAIAVKDLANGQLLEPADLINFIPFAPEVIKHMIDNMSIEKYLWENELTWAFIKKWDTEYIKFDIPGHLYLQYTQNRGKSNPNIYPTSFIFLNQNLANDVFGFIPKYVNYNNESGFNDEKFIPQAQSSEIIW